MSLFVATAVVVAILLAAVVVALRRDRRGRASLYELASEAGARAAVAVAMRGTIRDPEVREAWPLLCDALAQDWLSGAADVTRLRELLAAGGGVQLMEEASIDVDEEDETGERVLLYHIGFDPPRWSCPRVEFLAELDRLAAYLAPD